MGRIDGRMPANRDQGNDLGTNSFWGRVGEAFTRGVFGDFLGDIRRLPETPGDGRSPGAPSPSEQELRPPPPAEEASQSSQAAAPALSASVPEMSTEHLAYRAAVDGQFTPTMTAVKFRDSLSKRADIPDQAKQAIRDKLDALETGGAELDKVYITEYQHRVPEALRQNGAFSNVTHYTTQISVVDMTDMTSLVNEVDGPLAFARNISLATAHDRDLVKMKEQSLYGSGLQ